MIDLIGAFLIWISATILGGLAGAYIHGWIHWRIDLHNWRKQTI